MGEWNPFELSKFEYEILEIYMKYGYGKIKMYDIPFFSCHYTDEIVNMYLEEFYDKAIIEKDEIYEF